MKSGCCQLHDTWTVLTNEKLVGNLCNFTLRFMKHIWSFKTFTWINGDLSISLNNNIYSLSWPRRNERRNWPYLYVRLHITFLSDSLSGYLGSETGNVFHLIVTLVRSFIFSCHKMICIYSNKLSAEVMPVKQKRTQIFISCIKFTI